MNQEFDCIVVVGTGVIAEAGGGRIVQRITIPSLTTVEECQRYADRVLAGFE